jgi:hypothetical protein
MSLRALLDRQWKDYPTSHGSRLNLLLHIVVVPLFVAANVGLIVGMLAGSWRWMLVSLLTMVVSFGLQGLGHRTEPVRPLPFRGIGEAVARILLEQWITFPRFVMSGGWLRAMQQKTRESYEGGVSAE